MQITLSYNPICIGKDSSTVGQNNWQRLICSIDEFIDIHYVQGMAVTPALLKTTHKIKDNFLGASLLIVDIDKPDSSISIDELLKIEMISKHCIAIIPSSSHTDDAPRYHLYFNLSSIVSNYNTYVAIAGQVTKHIPYEVDKALNSPVFACYGTKFIHFDHANRADDGFIYVNPNATPIDIHETLRSYLAANPSIAHNDEQTISYRTEQYHAQPQDIRYRVAESAINYAYKNFDRQDYDIWLNLAFAVYDAFDGDTLGRDLILSHGDITWDSDKERRDFIQWWSSVKDRDSNKVTVASLFYAARNNGWLKHTSIELDSSITTSFYAEDLTQWFVDMHKANQLPSKMLCLAQTGQGKTRGIINLLKYIGIPKSLFIAPSIKLCTNLSHTLTSMGIDNTLYIDDGTTKDSLTLQNANVLVTTLQTFATKVASSYDISLYKFVVLDESDDLISAFVRGGSTIGYGSHVSREQSYHGIYALSELFSKCDYVYALDATATNITYHLGKEFSNHNFEVYANSYQRSKADVTLVSSLDSIRRFAIDSVRDGLKVVIAADTKRECLLLYEYLLYYDLVLPDEILLITGDTHYDHRVKQFFLDVEQGAKQYRVVIFNSAMGSGVSITDTKPDVFIQICNHITPRKNLQILNRYRQQGDVYIYVPHYERLYSDTAQEKIARLEQSAKQETILTGLPFHARNYTSTMIKTLAVMSITDEIEQGYAQRDFYTRLLTEDGRQITYYLEDDNGIANNLKEVRDVIKSRIEEIKDSWRSVPPKLDRGAIVTMEDNLRSIMHRVILRYTNGNIDDTGLSDYELADLALKYGRYLSNFKLWLESVRLMNVSRFELTDENKALTTLKLFVSRFEVLSLVGILFPDTETVLTADEVANKSAEFIRQVELRKDVYDSITKGNYGKFDSITLKGRDYKAAISLCKYILGMIGLTIRSKSDSKLNDSGKRDRLFYIDNVEPMLSLLSIAHPDNEYDDTLTFDHREYTQALAKSHHFNKQYAGLSAQDQKRIAAMLRETDNIYATERILSPF